VVIVNLQYQENSSTLYVALPVGCMADGFKVDSTTFAIHGRVHIKGIRP